MLRITANCNLTVIAEHFLKLTLNDIWLRNTVLDIMKDESETNLKAVVAIDGVKVSVALALLDVVAAATHAATAHARCRRALS